MIFSLFREIIRLRLIFGNNTHDDMMDDYVPDQK